MYHGRAELHHDFDDFDRNTCDLMANRRQRNICEDNFYDVEDELYDDLYDVPYGARRTVRGLARCTNDCEVDFKNSRRSRAVCKDNCLEDTDVDIDVDDGFYRVRDAARNFERCLDNCDDINNRKRQSRCVKRCA